MRLNASIICFPFISTDMSEGDMKSPEKRIRGLWYF